jgi:hypothetical protein
MQSEKITGIKSVDFKIKALGHGVVNWNGPTDVNGLVNGNVKKLQNHSMPKLRGYSNKRFKADGTYSLKFADEVDFGKNPLYISQNCIRYHLFRDQALPDLQEPIVAENMDRLLCSITGLVRGYVIPATENKRTSALLITDFIDQKGNGNYDQMGRSGSKEKRATKSGEDKSTSLFSKTTFGDTEYESYGSISIEQLQFISFSDKFSRRAMMLNNQKEGNEIAAKIADYLNRIATMDQAKAVYHSNYVRRGAIFDIGEEGILLNDQAIDILVNETLSRLRNLNIRQAKGYMYVASVEVDYNDGSGGKDMLRIKTNPGSIKIDKGDSKYAKYFEGV